MSNKDMMAILLKNDNLSELVFDNNILTYQGRTLDISNLTISDFFQSNYSPLLQNAKEISAEDLFNIFEIHTKKEESDNENINLNDLANLALNQLTNKKENLIISPDKYFNYLNSGNINEEQSQQIQDFELQISQCMKYSDYLLNDKKMFVNKYYNKINNLIFTLEEDPLSKLTNGEKYAIDKYNQILEDVKNFLNTKEQEKVKRLVRTNINTSLGYANAFIILLATIASGIVTAIALYLMVK